MKLDLSAFYLSPPGVRVCSLPDSILNIFLPDLAGRVFSMDMRGMRSM